MEPLTPDCVQQKKATANPDWGCSWMVVVTFGKPAKKPLQYCIEL